MRTILSITLCLFAACATDDTTDVDESEASDVSPWEDLEADEIDDLPQIEASNDLCVQHPVLCAIGRYEHAIKQQP